MQYHRCDYRMKILKVEGNLLLHNPADLFSMGQRIRCPFIQQLAGKLLDRMTNGSQCLRICVVGTVINNGSTGIPNAFAGNYTLW